MTRRQRELFVRNQSGGSMADETQEKKITLDEVMVSTLAMTDALVKILIEKGVITHGEFKAKLDTERANYLAVLQRMQ
jgi:hypothetical protein